MPIIEVRATGTGYVMLGLRGDTVALTVPEGGAVQVVEVPCPECLGKGGFTPTPEQCATYKGWTRGVAMGRRQMCEDCHGTGAVDKLELVTDPEDDDEAISS